MRFLGWVRKAIVGGLVAGAAVAGPALQDGHLTTSEIAYIVGSALVGAILVFWVPNGPKPGA